MKSKRTKRPGPAAHKLGSWHNVYKVCKGSRNFSLKKAKIAAEYTGTDPMVWVDPDKVQIRVRHFRTLEKSELVVPRKTTKKQVKP